MTTYSGIPAEVISRTLLVNDLRIHLFEAKPALSAAPLVLLIHGFPEIAYSWRKVLLPLSKAGYHVVAPDLRGFGQTTATNPSKTILYDDDLSPFRGFNLAKDIVSLVYALGYDSVAAVVGHDLGSQVAGYCAVIRPDLFRSVVMMSAPFTGPPTLTFSGPTPHQVLISALTGLASLDPPRKHYIMYYSSKEANGDMMSSPQGLHTFLREYFHMKSADWENNDPHPLAAPTAAAVSVLPKYYIMLKDETMPQSVQGTFSGSEPEWLTDKELNVYVQEYSRTGFQGGLDWYRCTTDEQWSKDLLIFSGKRIEIPAMFVAGKKDWGVYQYPGAVDLMQRKVCKKMDEEDFVLIDGAGHWVQQEKGDAVVEHLLRFLEKTSK